MLTVANRMKIDCQSHILPPAYAAVLARNRRAPLTRVDDDSFTVTYPGMQTLRMDRRRYSVANKLRAMDAAGIDVSVISVNMPGPELLEPEVGVAAARTCNEELAAACARHPQRLVGLACLPWQVPDAALAELERAAGALDLRGVMLYSHVGDGAVDGAACLPIYARLEELGLPLVLHPCVPPWGAEISDYSMITMVGLMVDHSFAALRLILSGVLERYPRLRVVQPHCGGVLPYLWGRIRHQTEVMGRGTEHLSRRAGELYRRVYLDTASPWPPALRLVHEFAGAERMLFSSDHPWVEIPLLMDALDQLGLSPADQARIYAGNAQDLFAIG